ncbi:cytochrome P450 [Gyrodon lividus]|nr:cytochrome P450 [Gyrodon lividus]
MHKVKQKSIVQRVVTMTSSGPGMPDGTLQLFSLLVAAFSVYWCLNRKQNIEVPLPPGPPPLPVIGNLRDMSLVEPWITYKKLGEKYGDLVHLRMLSRDIIVLNSLDTAKALLEKRSHNYSTRPHIAVNEFLGISYNTALLPYSNEWRLHRKVFQQSLRAEGVIAYHSMQRRMAHVLIKNITNSPADYVEHLATYSAAVIMSAAYNYPVHRGDPMVTKIKTALSLIVANATPQMSALLVAFPFIFLVPRIPPWFPGASLQRTAATLHKLVECCLEEPFDYVVRNMAEGLTAPCIVGDAITRANVNQPITDNIKKAIKAAASTSFAAGAGSTDDALQVFVLAMTMHPEVQKLAQEEIEAVVGSQRLPNFGDRPNLPYVEAVFRETLRWHPVFPLALPHSTTDDDVYKGYFIPKGVTIIPNVWAMAHDENAYPDPFVFNPRRFLKEDGALNDDTVSYVFGFGRRICVGRHFSSASIWSAIVNLLAAFVFETPRDERGIPCEVVPEFTSGLTS